LDGQAMAPDELPVLAGWRAMTATSAQRTVIGLQHRQGLLRRVKVFWASRLSDRHVRHDVVHGVRAGIRRVIREIVGQCS
jgi:hypothetical protein